ncbi:acyclic terpene utilization AtuA family protein [Prescottella sp. R16]|uniref:acyclic terpene utilization AtuA family protein n=1 Tax=Prescottella sp. R16 TaxID=3064529 RepID=UPI00272EA909|nr:acyclic terpene utilization AtuA family protein [Prescottella sp. R16]
MTLRIANCSGFLGDRRTGPKEMVEGGPIDYLTGDWLAELTMSILAKQRGRDPEAGYPASFVEQMSDVLSTCHDRGITVIANAGGVNPHGCADALRAVADRQGLDLTIAVVDGDDITDRFAVWQEQGWLAAHLDSGAPFATTGLTPTVVNAYLGCWGIVEALRDGADIVVTGRVSDASPIVAAAAAHYGWTPHDLDRLAGAVVAGHIIECSAQATGGNFAFFTENRHPHHPGFPIAEIEPDGSVVITKHEGTAGMVTVDTVTAQLLYEIDGPRYANPDVIARLDELVVEQVGTDRVRVSGAFGEQIPSVLKAGAVADYGWSTEMTMLVTGLDRDRKVDYALNQLWAEFPRGRETFADVEVNVIGGGAEDPRSLDEATALLRVAVADQDKALVNRFSRVVVELLLGGYPGMALTSPPARARQRQLFWPTLIPADRVRERVTIRGTTREVERARAETVRDVPLAVPPRSPEQAGGDMISAPLGRIAGSRSGDKGGNATLGIWARTDAAHEFLCSWWTPEHVTDLLRAPADTPLRLWHLPNLRAVGVTVVGWLDRGTATNILLDTQAKGLGEFVRARHIDIPRTLLDGEPGILRA